MNIRKLNKPIKLKDLLLENPDTVYDDDRAVNYNFSIDARAFIIDPDSDIWVVGNNRRIVHGYIVDFLYECFRKSGENEKVLIDLIKENVSLSTSKNLIGILDLIKKHENDEQGEDWEAKGPRLFGITGRIWTESKNISFWKRLSDIKPHMNKVENFIKTYSKLKPEEFKYDFIDKKDEDPLMSYSEVVGSNKIQNLSDEDYLEKLKTIHTMDSRDKNRELRRLGSKTGSEKYSDISKKSGYDNVVSFNYDTNMNEEIIQLKVLLEQCICQSTHFSEDKINYINKFIQFVKQFLNIKNHYPVYIVDKNEVPTTTAYFSPTEESIKVAVKDRALPDCLRSLGHEFVHAKQHEMSELHEKSGNTGSKQENQANSLAGIMMRYFSKENPDIYKTENK